MKIKLLFEKLNVDNYVTGHRGIDRFIKSGIMRDQFGL